ncbi:CII family transcriptional regulator [Ottowia sp. VDI28]|uniref:CII family transcriptional regulator n=1 Tax=Ottowia sp. VDI28 TaxID=3133968 RepID=UPI003C2AB1E4
MSEVSPDLRESARKIETILRNSLAEFGQARVADKMNVSESTISRMKSEDIERMAMFIAAMGLRVIGQDYRVISIADLNALRHFAARGLPHVGL